MPIGRTGPILGGISGAISPPEGLSRTQGLVHGLLSGIPIYRLLSTFAHAINGTTGQWSEPGNNPANHPENFGGAPAAAIVGPQPGTPGAPPTFEGDPTDPNNPANYRLDPSVADAPSAPTPAPSSFDAFNQAGMGLNSFTRVIKPYDPNKPAGPITHAQGIPGWAAVMSSWIRGRNLQ